VLSRDPTVRPRRDAAARPRWAEGVNNDTIELEIGPPGHGGFCVARHEGRVVFVRHSLPGERVRARITEDAGSYLRADAVEILEPSPDRVPAPCPYARPGRCGGCDWQHASGLAQRELKAAVVREQFARVAGLDVTPLLSSVEELPGGLLGWRTRITYAVGRDGRPGLHRHRSHEVEHVDRCLLGVPGVGDSDVLHRNWPGISGIEVVRAGDGDLALVEHRPGGRQHGRGRRPPDRTQVIEGPPRIRHGIGGREFEIDAAGFWQVHPAAPVVLGAALLAAVAPEPGETVLELYAGAGPLTALLADAVGPGGRVLGVESSGTAVADAAHNLAELPQASVVSARVTAASVAALDLRPDLVVLDPPRAGAGADVMRVLTGLGPRAIGYVSCDPATLARDVRAAHDGGYELSGLRAFDAFPMTAHIECVAILARSSAAKSHAPRTL
jgi:tRNA/tmRNA/rRNA uracil-C5-methylase (TrmA/RlmC/RlmD family)